MSKACLQMARSKKVLLRRGSNLGFKNKEKNMTAISSTNSVPATSEIDGCIQSLTDLYDKPSSSRQEMLLPSVMMKLCEACDKIDKLRILENKTVTETAQKLTQLRVSIGWLPGDAAASDLQQISKWLEIPEMIQKFKEMKSS
jgi:hypothetical protein